MHPTPLRGPKIGAILNAGTGSTPVLIYQGGAADGQLVGQAHQPLQHTSISRTCDQ
jgi:hypothetical protein